MAQAAFDAAWDLQTQQHMHGPYFVVLRPQHLADPASSYAPDLARWLDDGGPNRTDSNAVVSEGQSRHSRIAPAYPFLSDQPQTPTAGFLGRLGRYRVIWELGRGAASVVFAAEKDSLDDAVPTPCVVKVLAPIVQPAEQARARARFVRDAKTACHLDHRNIVRVHDAAEESGVAWVAMDYVHGPSLRDLMVHHNGPMPLDLALDLVRQVALGLAAAHASAVPVIHCDLKPADVLLERVPADATYPHGWRALVCDFGLARALHDQCDTRSEGAVGTIAYLSPEQLTGSTNISPTADMFALGVIAYEMLTGAHPYWHSEDDTSPAVARRILSAVTPPPREVNPAIPEIVAEFVLQMLHHTPEHRPSAAEVTVKLSGLLWENKGVGGQLLAPRPHVARAPDSDLLRATAKTTWRAAHYLKSITRRKRAERVALPPLPTALAAWAARQQHALFILTDAQHALHQQCVDSATAEFRSLAKFIARRFTSTTIQPDEIVNEAVTAFWAWLIHMRDKEPSVTQEHYKLLPFAGRDFTQLARPFVERAANILARRDAQHQLIYMSAPEMSEGGAKGNSVTPFEKHDDFEYLLKHCTPREREILEALWEHESNWEQAAAALNISRATVYRTIYRLRERLVRLRNDA